MWNDSQDELWNTAEKKKLLFDSKYYEYMNFMINNYGDLDSDIVSKIIESDKMSQLSITLDTKIELLKKICILRNQNI